MKVKTLLTQKAAASAVIVRTTAANCNLCTRINGIAISLNLFRLNNIDFIDRMLQVSPILPDNGGCEGAGRHASANQTKQTPVGVRPHLATPGDGFLIERAMRPMIPVIIDRLPQIIGRMLISRFGGLLGPEAGFAEIVVTKTWKELITLDHNVGGTYPQTSADDSGQ